TPVSDAQLEELAKLKNLKSLTLDQTQITDAGLAKLQECESLKKLSIKNLPNLSSEAIAKLKEALPELEVVR
ncbi:MAG: hypothetical protein KDA65_05310, partial [Planctomycetaceae bacterium]|nr:hypothetical protein [Planctomycetaceae bacterium]